MIELSDGSYYTGMTNDLNNRLKVHAEGKGSKYVRSRLPIKRVVYLRECHSKSEARRIEIQIKSLSRKDKEELCEKDASQLLKIISS